MLCCWSKIGGNSCFNGHSTSHLLWRIRQKSRLGGNTVRKSIFHFHSCLTDIARLPLKESDWLPSPFSLLSTAPESLGQINSKRGAEVKGHEAAHVALQETQCARCPQPKPRGRWDHRCSFTHAQAFCNLRRGQFSPHYRTAKMLYINNSDASGTHCTSTQTEIWGLKQQRHWKARPLSDYEMLTESFWIFQTNWSVVPKYLGYFWRLHFTCYATRKTAAICWTLLTRSRTLSESKNKHILGWEVKR